MTNDSPQLIRTQRALINAASIALLPLGMLGAAVVLTAFTASAARVAWRAGGRG